MSRGSRRTPAERRQERGSIEDPAIVLAAAARLLEVRPRSEAEVRRRLEAAGYRAELVTEAVARLVTLGYLDDAAFARSWVESRDRARPRGERALRLELRRQGVAPGLIDAVMQERDDGAAQGTRPGSPGVQPSAGPGASDPGGEPDAAPVSADVAAASRLLARRRSALDRVADPRRRQQRAYGLLARNGFDPETIRTVLEREIPREDEGREDGVGPDAD